MQIDEDLKEYEEQESELDEERDFDEELDEEERDFDEELDEEERDFEEPLAPSHQPIMVPLSQAILISGATGVSTLIFGLLLVALYMSMQRRTKVTPHKESTEVNKSEQRQEHG